MVSEIGKKLNSIAEENNYFFVNYIPQNKRGLAFLTDTTKWDKYRKDGLNDIRGTLFAIGGPSVELFGMSYNTLSSGTKVTDNLSFGEHGYLDRALGLYTADCLSKERNGIYRPIDDTAWYLASPSGHNQYCMLSCRDEGAINPVYMNWTVYYRPIVCFRTSIFNEIYLGSLK